MGLGVGEKHLQEGRTRPAVVAIGLVDQVAREAPLVREPREVLEAACIVDQHGDIDEPDGGASLHTAAPEGCAGLDPSGDGVFA